MSQHAEPSQGAEENEEQRGPILGYNATERDFEHGDEVAAAKRMEAAEELRPAG